MGGFTSAPLILAARRAGARTFLHESNTIPGRANRWLCRVVDHVFVGFPSTQNLLPRATVSVTGTPIRSEFQPQDAHVCRTTMGLDPNRPVVLVMGGSHGASAINRLVMDALPLCARSGPELQWLHLTGSRDEAPVRRAYVELGVKAAVFPFVSDMAKVMGAATVAVSRAGASALAEIAALCLPAVLVPYPSAAGNHQFYNALAFEQTGAARLLEQRRATPDGLVSLLLELVRTTALREPIQRALVRWQAPHAAQHIARIITESAA